MIKNTYAKIFSYPAIKLLWYSLSLLFIKKSTLPEYQEKFDYMIWGKAENHKEQKIFPKIIWSYWNGKKSSCAEACRESWNSYQDKFSINILNPAIVRKFLPNFPELPAGIPEQKVSNLIRLMLLERYGGIWVDYSTILTQPLDWVLALLKDNDCEALAFYNEHSDEYCRDHSRPIIENGFLAATPNSDFIRNWRSIYQECIQSNNYKNFFRNREDFDDLTRNFINKSIDHIDYFVCYIAAQYVMSHSRNYRLFLINAKHEYYFTYYNVSPPRNKRKFSEEILLTSCRYYPLPRLIKIPGGHRERIDEYIRYKCFRKQSVLGRYL